MQFVIDVHLHSRFARATSRDLNCSNLHKWSALKGVDIVGTGDYTHPEWFAELSAELEPAEDGLYRLRAPWRDVVERELPERCRREVRFMLSVEISTIYKKGEKTRKIHHIVILPSLDAVARLNQRLGAIGNLHSDGRPILGLDSRDLLEICLEADPDVLFVPAHIWTPHFAALGASSGFDSLEECYGDLLPHIFAVETGLSSDPPMNWRLSALDRYALISNSDAHSPQKLAREATLFDAELSYPGIYHALKDRDPARFIGTLEFYPEEGKYHYDGHRKCHVCWKPAQTLSAEGVCPVCGRKLTVGVLHRVELLADRPEGFQPDFAPSCEYLIPLDEVIGAAVSVGPRSKKVRSIYDRLLAELGPELGILRRAEPVAIENCAGALVAEAVRRMRSGEVDIYPGHDGEYGVVSVFSDEERERLRGQSTLFDLGAVTSAIEPVPTEADVPVSDAEPFPRADRAQRAVAAKAHSSLPIGHSVDGLDDAQRQVVEAEGGPLVALAGPGAGKTRVLTRRIAQLVECGVAPGAIMAITFTRRAAGEMRQRLAGLLNGVSGLGAMQVGTFHRLALGLLRQLGVEDKLVLDELEARRVLAVALEEVGLKDNANEIAKVLSLAKALGQGPEEIEGKWRPHYVAYQTALATHGARDYDDILLDLLQFLTADSAACAHIQQRYSHLFVDEFQDLNPVQYRLVLQLAGSGVGLMAIGDPDQAIYGFRGADPGYFSRLREDYPDARLFQLGTNYRSQAMVVEGAASVIGHNPNRVGMALTAARQPGAPIRLIEASSEAAEAIAVVREIGRMVGGADMQRADEVGGEGERSFADFAVLFRTGRQGRVLAEYFEREGLPYLLVGQKGLLQSPSVQAMLAFARYALDPRESLRRIQAQAAVGDEDLALLATEYGALAEDAEAWVERWREQFGTADDEGLAQLQRMAAVAETLERLLETVLLGADADYEERGGPPATEAVSLMTLHAAKGLEFPVVFICGVEDGLVPMRREGTDTAEERRLFYVGMTRAAEELVLLSARSREVYSERVESDGSPFIAEMPEEMVQRERMGMQKKAEAEQMSLF